MTTRERPIDRGHRLARADRITIGAEIRAARRTTSGSIEAVASSAGMSPSQVGRIERGVLASVSVEQLARVGAVVGLDVRVHAYPGPDPTLDAGQLALLNRLRARLAPTVTVRLEVPIPIPRDQRAWDAMLGGLHQPPGFVSDGSVLLPADADTRIIDVQAQLRRIRLKLRDSGMLAVLWVVADTSRNRAALAGAGPLLAADFPISARRALAALRAGRHPGGSAIVVL